MGRAVNRRRVLVDERGLFIAGIDRQGDVLVLAKTKDPERALDATPEAEQMLEDWEKRCNRYGRYDGHHVIEIETHAAAC